MRYYSEYDDKTVDRLNFRFNDIRLHSIIIYAVETYGLYNILSQNNLFGGNVGGSILLMAAIFIGMFVLNIWFLEKYYVYFSIAGFHGALLGSWIYYTVLGMSSERNSVLSSKGIGCIIYLVAVVIAILIKISVYKINHYDVFRWRDKDVLTKILSTLFTYATLVIICGIFSYNIATFIFAGILTGITMYLIDNRKLTKDEMKSKQNWDRISKDQEDVLKEAARQEAQREAAKEYKEQYKKSMGWKSEFDNNQSSDDAQKAYEQWFNKSNARINGESAYFGGCDTLEKLESRHKSLAKAFHPDVNCGDTGLYEKMQEEYEVLRKAF